jgi:predicted neutral ceramidase superfamily lipid hydrolase
MAEEQRSDADPEDGRRETVTERLDRNWNALLQELRVVQTGTQLLTGFLLTVAFQQTFKGLDDWQKALYLVAVSLAVLSTIFALMPVALHRALFRRGAMAELVSWGDRMVQVGLGTTGLAIICAGALVFSTAAGVGGAVAAGVVGLAAVLGIWLVLPLRLRRGTDAPHDAAST